MTALTRREFVSAVAAGIGSLPLACRRPEQPPNILLVLADQFRASALGCLGNPHVHTPHLDALAATGVAFTQAFACAPVCSPCRAQILTGKLTGEPGKGKGLARLLYKLPLEETTLAEVLHARGYATGYIGKWHLSPRGTVRADGFVPPGRARQGFDEWAAVEVPRGHYDTVYYRDTPEPLVARGFACDVETDLAIDFLRRHRDGPFCLVVSWNPPHHPYEPPPEHDRYAAADLPVPLHVPEGLAERARRSLAKYYGLVSAVDANLGRLVAALAELNLRQETIVTFLSDHGDMLYSRGVPAGQKRRPWRESSQVPWLLSFPRRLEAGRRWEGLAGSIDVLPTLLGLAGVAAPPGVQGADLSAALCGEEATERDSLFLHMSGTSAGTPMGAPWRAVRTRDAWFAISGGVAGGDWLLYDLHGDPDETRNLVGNPAYRPLKEDLRERLAGWRRRIGDDLDLAAFHARPAAAPERRRGATPQ